MPKSLNPLDYLLLIYFALGAWQGFRLGIVQVATGLMGLIGAWAAAALLTGKLVTFADTRWDLVARFQESLERIIPLPDRVPTVGELLGLVASLPLPAAYRESISQAVESAALQASTAGDGDLSLILYHLLALGVVHVIAFVVIFCAARTLFQLLGAALQPVLDRGPLKLVNRAGGTVFGVLRNAVVAALVLGLLTPLLALANLPWLSDLIDGSTVAGALLTPFYSFSPWLFGALGGTAEGAAGGS